MVVAMVAMRMMQVSIDQIIDVIAMRHGFVSAARPMHVSGVMPRAAVLRRAGIGIGRGHLDHMLVDMIAMGMMQMAVMEVVHVTAMLHGRVPATGAMDMRMVGMRRVLAVGHVALRDSNHRADGR